MLTNTARYYDQTQKLIFGVIIHTISSRNKSVRKFKVTTLNREICDYINHVKENYSFSAFTTMYDALKHIESTLTPEDIFMLHLEDCSKILVDHWYLRDSDSVEYLEQSKNDSGS